MPASFDEFDDSDGEDGFDDAGLAELAEIEEAYAAGRSLPPKSIVSRVGLKQRDLFGGTIVDKVKVASGSGSRTSSTGSGNGSGANQMVAKVRAVKVWDPASFAKHGWSKKLTAAKRAVKGKGKAKAYGSDEEPWGDEEEDVADDGMEEDYLDPEYDPSVELFPIKWQPDGQASKTWHYPVQNDKPLRTYQYNIVHRCLFENTLVSLPTGLGKTFIAACVMLNFYRWFPQGKIIFLAPTRPLVAQQVKACHYIAGIPQSDSIELTGQTPPKLRAIAWATKRVIYCTPQTVENDLAKGRLDARDVTCLVVDEAHRATGDYAYCGVVRFLMSRNQHFRVLALTATPGAKGEAVQQVIDNLHIGKIEVRTDESFDIVPYVHKKSFDLTVVPLGATLTKIRDAWGGLMQNYMGPLLRARLIFQGNPAMLAPYAVNMANAKIKDLEGGAKANGRYYPMIKTLGSMARAMEYLVIQSVSSFLNQVKDLESSGPKTLTGSPAFRDVLKECGNLQATPGYVGHPKMEKLRSMCIQHFMDAEEDLDEEGNKRETRVMVFCNYRAVVEEIVDCLNQQRPIIRATSFVGQGAAKGVKGINQKDQIETIKKFKAGVYNILVATSIGEEGLDIGEIDLIVCYEANKSPIRMLQRVGRTGRARDGRIIVLMTEEREEKNWDTANDAYTEVQNALVSNKVFELYVDGDRMLPKTSKPEVDKVSIKALPLDLTSMTMVGQDRLLRKATAEEQKQKKKDAKKDEKRNMPDDAFAGFRTAGQLAADAKAGLAPSPAQELRDRKKAALLTVEEETILRERWQCASTQRVSATPIDTYGLTFDRGFTGSALCIPRHSTKHLDLLALMQMTKTLEDGNEEAQDAWHLRTSTAFDPQLVTIWKTGQGPAPPHPTLRCRPPSSDPPSSLPDPAQFPSPHPTVPQQSFNPPSSPLLPSSSAPAFVPPPPKPISKMAAPLPPPRKPILKKAAPASLPPKPVSKKAATPPAPKQSSSRSQTIYELASAPIPSFRASIDLYNVLSSDPEDAPVAGPSNGPSMSYGIDDDDDFDLDMPESQLMRGAVVRGSPPKRPLEELVVDSEEEEEEIGPAQVRRTGVAGPSKGVEEPEVIDSDDDDFIPVALKPQRPAPAPAPAAPRVPLVASSVHHELVPDSDEEVLPLVEEDDYALFDLPDEDMEAAFAIASPTRSPILLASRTTKGTAESTQVAADHFVVPPLRSAVERSEVQYKKRPQHHRIPDSSSSSIARSIPRPLAASTNRAVPDDSFEASPIVMRKGAAKRKTVIETSSPERPPSAGPSRYRTALPSASIEPPVNLNRLRRGRAAEEEPSPVPKSKKVKKPKKMTDKEASRCALFDFEAINSSASQREASSEAYNSEDEEDRQFVASGDWEDEEDSQGHDQFVRDSIQMTQAPGFAANNIFRRGEPAKQRKVYKGTPQTPRSQDQWSYDSFCVADDDEIEMENSSQL